ncbi:MAG: VCBS repeat-containing protein [Caldilineaceae bacterium]
MADINNDSYPDLILQSGVVLYNDQSGNFQPALSLALLLALDSQVTTADLNGDGRLDLIVGHRDRAAMIYLQTQAGQFAPPFPLDANSYPATSIVTGDLNSDNHLDIVVGRGSSSLSTSSQAAPNLIYFNNGNGGFGSGTPFSTISDDTQAVALGDLDADGDLDIAVANATVVQGVQQGQQNYLYFNDGTGSFAQPRPVGPGTDRSRTVAIGDLNGDGQLDLVFGNEDQLNTLYVNDGSGGFQQSVPIGQLPDATTNLLLVDLDQDRDLDLIAANALQADALFLNNGQGQLTAMAAWAEPSPNARAWTVGAGDLDRDGDIDLVADLQPLSLIPQLADCVMVAKRIAPPTTAEHLPRVVLQQPGQTVGSGPYASAQLFAQAEIPIDFFLFDPAATAVNIQGYYSLNGGGQWYPALASAATATRDLATKSGSGPAHHRFTWDVYGNQFLGHSDNVIFRLEVLPSQQPVQNGQPIGAPRGYVAAESSPLRVRGTQVRVVNENGMPVVGALLYKLSPDSATRADSFPLRNGSAVRTNPMGFIESRGQLSPGDQLIALQPISATHAFTLYHSSATPSNSGLNPFVVRAAGIQTLTVRSENSLTLFNLQLSLEWDARNDASFLGDLQRAIENASDVLFDVTEGQVALGDVTVYQAKEAWNNAHVVIYASNSIHPSATMGGVVITPTSEIGINGIIPAAYWPGQVRMGPQWDPFGQNEAELRQDWWLAFAHELAHYLLFLPDNYLGVEDGILRHIDCQGSFMTNTYEETYREFLTRDRWDQQENCWRKSIAAHLTGRSDWETVGTFLPWLQLPSNAAAINPGPMWLPLRMTRVIMTAPPSTVPPATLPTRNFDLRNNETGEITRLQQATAYLIKQRNTPQLEDDEIIALGSTGAGSDRIKVRGAQEGDRLCLFENNRVVPLLGCEILRADSTSIRLHEVEGWQPEIAVTPLNSVTIAIDLVQAIDSRQELRVQLLPADGQSLDGRDAVAPWATMQRVDGPAAGHFQQTIVLAQPVFAGYVRVWLVDDPLGREAITQFALSAGWGPNSRPTSHVDRRVWGPNSRPTSHANQRAWGANSRAMGAPVASSDGRATIFNVENVLGESGASVLQTVNTFPALPLWLAPVGSGYSYVGNTAFDKTIAFHYLEREVPKGYEHTLTLYYGPNVVGTENAVSWQRLSTVLDTDENFAAAKMPQNAQNGEGIYVLMATVEMPALTRGWNLFAYPIPGEREVATALASVAGAYSAIYHLDPGRTTPWKLYDPTVVNAHPAYATLINDLDALRFGHSYWLHVTSAITPYLAIGSVDGSGTTNAAVVNTLLPPSTLYGPLTVEESVVLTSGVKVNALVNGVVCGEGEILQSNGEWIYKLQVAAGDGKNGCGYFEAPISVVGHGFVAREEPLWNNRRALYQPLILRATNTSSPRTPVDPKDQPSDGSGELSYQIYLPILKR